MKHLHNIDVVFIGRVCSESVCLFSLYSLGEPYFVAILSGENDFFVYKISDLNRKDGNFSSPGNLFSVQMLFFINLSPANFNSSVLTT